MSVEIRTGDALSVLAEMPAESVHCVVTSPPYWNLRAYKGDPGMIGLEPTFDEHLENLVAVFREVRRVLRKDGTLWLNYGDAYSGGVPGGASPDGARNGRADMASASAPKRGKDWKPKDLMLMPARVAMALQADGWFLRSEIVLAKRNPMPESVTDRPTSAHEKMFLLSKAPRYFWDAEAVREPVSGTANARRSYKTPDGWDTGPGAHGSVHRQGREKGRIAGVGPKSAEAGSGIKNNESMQAAVVDLVNSRNLRNVWFSASEAYREAHFAVMPTAWVEPCIKAGTSEKGACAECGAPWVREDEQRLVPTAKAAKTGVIDARDYAADANDGGADRQKDGHVPGHRNEFTTTGWSPSCECDADAVPCGVLDPFGGSGTVGLVADRLQRDAILIEISPEYAEMARRRVTEDAPLFAQAAQ